MADKREPNEMRFPAGTDADLLFRFLLGDENVKLEKHEIFTHIDKEGQCSRAFNVTMIQKYIDEHKSDFEVVGIAIDRQIYEQCRTERGYEQERLNRITFEVITKIPVLFVEIDGSYLMIDGTHRGMKAFELGLRVIPGYIIPESIWSNFLVPVEKGLTAEELLKRKSGIDL